MIHLTDELLNEYLDNEIEDRKQVEQHLASCDACAARLSALQRLFNQIESLPDLAVSRQLTPPLTLRAPSLPRWLTWTASLQAAFAVIALITTAPWILQLISPYFPGVQVPSSTEILLELQSLWLEWLTLFSQVQVPTLPSIPVLELSSFVIVFTLIGVSILWLVGNGLLLRNQIK